MQMPQSLPSVSARNWSEILSDLAAECQGDPLLDSMTGVSFHFAHPHHSWERGFDENMNGLRRLDCIPSKK